MQRRAFLSKSMAATCVLAGSGLSLLSSAAQAEQAPKNLTEWKTRLEAQIGFPLLDLRQEAATENLKATFANGEVAFSLYSTDADRWFSVPVHA